MKTLENENYQELTKKVLDLITKTSIELGHRTYADSLLQLTNSFALDLQKENRFRRMTFNQIEDAFHRGVRYAEFEPFLNIRTFFKFINAHKLVVDDARNKVEVLNQNPNQVPYYQEPLKLLK
tara:strand:- start:38 stop:406 length:369 start_codon:yes stop_codon:yes gene_type:complete